MSLSDRVRVIDVTLLSDNWGKLAKTTLDFRRADGTWQRQVRETYDRGNGATILLYNVAKRTVILTRQFRFPAFVTGHDDLLIETPAGLLDQETPEARIKSEAEEETGFRARDPVKIFDAYMSPGSVTEKLSFFVAAYEPADQIGPGGGLAQEGEDIETLEVGIDEAMAMVRDGRILDAKTIMLLQHACLSIFG